MLSKFMFADLKIGQKIKGNGYLNICSGYLQATHCYLVFAIPFFVHEYSTNLLDSSMTSDTTVTQSYHSWFNSLLGIIEKGVKI